MTKEVFPVHSIDIKPVITSGMESLFSNYVFVGTDSEMYYIDFHHTDSNYLAQNLQELRNTEGVAILESPSVARLAISANTAKKLIELLVGQMHANGLLLPVQEADS